MRYPTVHTSLAVLLTALSAVGAQAYPDCPAAIDNFYQCERHKEADLLQKEPSLATRQDGRLRINIDRGPAVWMVDKSAKGVADDDVVRYALSKTFPGTPFVEVSASFYEGSARYLLNRSTGEKTLVTGASLLSPDAQRFVVWSDDEAYMTPFLRVYRIDGTALKVEFEATQLAQGWPQEVRWASNTEVAFRGLEGGDFRLTARKGQNRAAARWHLSTGPSKPGERR